MASTQPALQHPSLGTVRGIRPERHPDVDQYLGIQYATLANRFARGALVEKPTSPIEATKRGYVGRMPAVASPFLPLVILKVQQRSIRSGASIEIRNSHSRTRENRPLPIADPGNCDREHLLLQHALPHPDYEFSDTECLALNVSVPSSSAAGSLPVVVLMHGGGFVTGSAHWPQYDLANLVSRSVKVGHPIVAVGIK